MSAGASRGDAEPGATHRTPVLEAASLLRDGEKVEALATLQIGLLVELVQGDARRPVHEQIGCLHAASVSLHERGGEAGRDAEEGQEQEDADVALVGLEAADEHLLGDKAQLEVVAGEHLDGVDDLFPRRQVVEGVDGRDGAHRRRTDGRRIQAISTRPLRIALRRRFLGPRARVAVLSVVIGLSALRKDALKLVCKRTARTVPQDGGGEGATRGRLTSPPWTSQPRNTNHMAEQLPYERICSSCDDIWRDSA